MQSTRRTRRPASDKQSQHNITAERPPRSSPFTRAPLQPKSTTTQPLFSGQAGYGYTYPPPPPQAQPGYPQGQNPPQQANGQEEDTGVGSDAWEAAQSILKAINFGSLIQMGQGKEKKGNTAGGDGNTASGQNHPPPVIASAGVDVSSMGRPTQAPETSGAVLTPEDRASLQAQLALLAAQMAELAEGGENESNMLDVIADTTADGEGDWDEDEDEDMEMVDVPVAAPSTALNTG